MNHNMSVHADADFLICPETRQLLRCCTLEQAERAIADGQCLAAREPGHSPPFGHSPTVMLRQDNACAYPVVKGIPVLLMPEMLMPAVRVRTFDLSDQRFAVAYQEMAFYNAVAEKQASNIEKSDTASES